MNKVYDSILYAETINGNSYYQTRPYTLKEFFSSGNKLTIPDYQRPYSWGAVEVEAMLGDVQQLASSDAGSWFLGCLYLLRNASSNSELIILDGQQRTTTIVLIGISLLERVQSSTISKGEKKKIVRSLYGLLVNSDSQAKFLADQSLREVLANFIQGWVDLEEPEEYNQAVGEFRKEAKKIYSKTGLRTPVLIDANLNTIRKWMGEKLADDKSLKVWVEAFLEKCWLIQIPMQDELDTVKIFEALNNRGLPISLVDKLRFRSLICDGLSSSESKKIKKEWGKIFISLAKLDGRGLIKGEGDFFKVLFNVDGEGRDSESEFFALFDRNYNGVGGVNKFLSETRLILSVLESLDSPNSDAAEWAYHGIKSTEKQRRRAVLHLCYCLVKASANCRFLLFRGIIESQTKAKGSRSIGLNWIDFEKWFWLILKVVILKEVGSLSKSNEVRTLYLGYLKGNSGQSAQSCLSKVILVGIRLFGLDNFIMQPGGVQSHSRLLLAMYGYGKDSKQLSVFSDDELRRSEVDHMIPRAWQANWNDLKFSKKEVIDYVEKRATDFPNLDVTGFAKVISRDDFPIVMVRYTTAPNKNEYQILEMIGNRWILSKGLNGSAGNDSWANKRKAYSKVGTRVPANNDSLGIDAYKQTALFGYQEVIDRSLFICEEVRRQLVGLSKMNAKNPA